MLDHQCQLCVCLAAGPLHGVCVECVATTCVGTPSHTHLRLYPPQHLFEAICSGASLSPMLAAAAIVAVLLVCCRCLPRSCRWIWAPSRRDVCLIKGRVWQVVVWCLAAAVKPWIRICLLMCTAGSLLSIYLVAQVDTCDRQAGSCRGKTAWKHSTNSTLILSEVLSQ